MNAADVLRRVAQAVKGADRVEDASSVLGEGSGTVPGEGSGTVPGEGSGSGSDKGDGSVPDNTSESDLAKARAYRQIAGNLSAANPTTKPSKPKTCWPRWPGRLE